MAVEMLFKDTGKSDPEMMAKDVVENATRTSRASVQLHARATLSISRFAVPNTASIMEAVSFPVLVFWWLG